MKNVIGLITGLCLIVSQSFSQTQTVIANTTTTIATPYQNEDGPMRSKTFSKGFAVDQSDKIQLSNQYGSIQIKIWDRKEVQVDVDIKSYSNTEEEAQKLLDGVRIEASKSGDQISYKTRMEQEGKNWGSGSRNGKKWRREVRINYIVSMPAANALTLSNMYGSVNMGDLSGALYAKVQYGNFTAQNLNNTNNYVDVQYGNSNIQSLNSGVIKQQYGSAVTIGTVNTIDLNVQYAGVKITTIRGNANIKQQYGSGVSIGSVDDLNLDAQYANINIATIKGNANIDQQYNNLSIGSVGKLNLKSQYTSVTVGTLNGDGRFDMDYNKLNIGEVGNACKVLSVDGQYVAISLGFSNSYNADLDVHTNYASFKYADRVTAKQINETKDYSSSKDYSGRIGNGGNATVKIKSEYGSVTIK
jgi:hypothetical protein